MLGWRDAARPTSTGPTSGPARARRCRTFRQLFVAAAATARTAPAGIALERRTFCLRKRAEHATGVYFPSLSPRTLVYKGMLAEPQLEAFYPDLADERVTSALALVHSRFSTNTFPVVAAGAPLPLRRAQRRDQHPARQPQLDGRPRGAARLGPHPGRPARLSPIVTPDASDSATFDEVLELLHLGGRSLPHAVLMMIPEAWENHGEMDPARRAFYEFHSTLMEPWDGPALVSFTDGTVIGAVLDRNGLRPARYWVTEDGLVALASEVGVLDVRAGRRSCGRAAWSRAACSSSTPPPAGSSTTPRSRARWPPSTRTRTGCTPGLIHLDDLPDARARGRLRTPRSPSASRRSATPRRSSTSSSSRWPPPGRSRSARWATTRALAVLSERPRQLYDYFTQLFAQVTNPPLDAIREELVTSLLCQLGSEQNLLDAAAGELSQGDPAVPGARATTSSPRSSTSTTTGTTPASPRTPCAASFPRGRGRARPALAARRDRTTRSRRRSRTAPG